MHHREITTSTHNVKVFFQLILAAKQCKQLLSWTNFPYLSIDEKKREISHGRVPLVFLPISENGAGPLPISYQKEKQQSHTLPTKIKVLYMRCRFRQEAS